MTIAYVASAKRFLDSEPLSSPTFAQKFKDIIAEHLVELNAAAGAFDSGTTRLVNFYSRVAFFSLVPFMLTLLFFLLVIDLGCVSNAEFPRSVYSNPHRFAAIPDAKKWGYSRRGNRWIH